jgi:hypothetical protein
MIEALMVFSLAIMGIYFFKSTDLPKELTDRSAQMRAETGNTKFTKNSPKMSFAKDFASAEINLADMQKNKRIKDIELLNKQVDILTLEITTLEQQIADNSKLNAEIQAKIDVKLATLETLHSKLNALA